MYMYVINNNKNRKIDRKKIDDITEVCKLVFSIVYRLFFVKVSV